MMFFCCRILLSYLIFLFLYAKFYETMRFSVDDLKSVFS